MARKNNLINYAIFASFFSTFMHGCHDDRFVSVKGLFNDLPIKDALEQLARNKDLTERYIGWHEDLLKRSNREWEQKIYQEQIQTYQDDVHYYTTLISFLKSEKFTIERDFGLERVTLDEAKRKLKRDADKWAKNADLYRELNKEYGDGESADERIPNQCLAIRDGNLSKLGYLEEFESLVHITTKEVSRG